MVMNKLNSLIMKIPLMSNFSPFHLRALGISTLLLLISIPGLATRASGSDLITGHYVSASGKSIVLTLKVGKPAPSNLIVEQYVSPGNKVQATTPKAVKVDNKRGKIKWLFRNTKSGKLQLTITLQNALKGQVEAMARYRDPRDGKFTELQIEP